MKRFIIGVEFLLYDSELSPILLKEGPAGYYSHILYIIWLLCVSLGPKSIMCVWIISWAGWLWRIKILKKGTLLLCYGQSEFILRDWITTYWHLRYVNRLIMYIFCHRRLFCADNWLFSIHRSTGMYQVSDLLFFVGEF